MDTVTLSRLQFAVATYFHFLFVPLTLGLSLLLAFMETRYVTTGREEYRAMAKFWGRLFLINFVVGVVTGITLEFQFGTNWSRYSRYVGDIFGSLLAIEATVAFFLESTFIGVWAFGWKRLSPKMHAVAIWLVAIASNISAIWILIANAWMQHPVGYVMKNGRPVLSDFIAVVTQQYAVLTILHTLFAAYVVAGFFVMAVSAFQISRNQFPEFFKKSFRMGLVFASIFTLFVIIEGHTHGTNLVDTQPAKLAALEAHWVTQPRAPVHIFALPNLHGEGNRIEIGAIPGVMSLLAHHSFDATVQGLFDIPRDERPPVLATFASFKIMVGIGMFLLALLAAAWCYSGRLETSPLFLQFMAFSLPLPYLACLFGWTVAEVGRQPWIVYGLMKTAQGSSPIAPSQAALSLVAFILVYAFIGITAFFLMGQAVKKGPDLIVSKSSGKEAANA